MDRPVAYRRAMLLMTASSMFLPVFGLLSAPLLAHALGVSGRGEVAAALAPNLLVAGIATLGLTDALTYHVAQRPFSSRRGVAWASLFAGLAGVVCTVVVLFAADFLSGGDSDLARLIVIATALAVPVLIVAMLRGAASGRQLWTAIAIERLISAVLRLALLVTFLLIDDLTVLTAVLISAVTPIVAGAAYWRLFRRHPDPVDLDDRHIRPGELLAFGSRSWLGSVAVMVMGRLSALLVTPLSDVRQLGLLVVAITISDVPYMFATTIRDVVFGTSSAEQNTERLATTSRLATLLALAGSLVLGGTLPLWISPVFGGGFVDSIVPTWILLTSSVVTIPGLIAGAALAAANRPALRSATLISALVVNFGLVLLLTPIIGAVGAALSALSANVVMTGLGMLFAYRLLRVTPLSMLPSRTSDITDLVREARVILGRLPVLRRS